MPIEFKVSDDTTVAVLPASLDDSSGQELVRDVKAKVLKGGKLVIDASAVAEMDVRGLTHLLSVRRYVTSPDQKNLLIAGLTQDAWRKIEDENFADMFDPRSSVEEAVSGFSGATSTMPPPPTPPGPSGNERIHTPPEEDAGWGRRSTDTSSPNGTSPDKDVPTPASDWESWSKKPITSKTRKRKAVTPKQWAIYGACATAVVVAGILVWYFTATREPTLELVFTSVEAGRDSAETVAIVNDGRLEYDRKSLPKGLDFSDTDEEENPRTYRLIGLAADGAESSAVSLTAVNGDRRSESKSLKINVPPPKLQWKLGRLKSVSLKAGKKITEDATFVERAPLVEASGLPPGLSIEQSPENKGVWQLTGTPTEAGVSEAFLKAGSDQQSISLTVAAAEITPDPPPPGPPPGPKPQPGPDDPKLPGPSDNSGEGLKGKTVIDDPPPTPPGPTPKRSDDMRRFLLDRIDKLDSRRFSMGEIATLYAMVSFLKDSDVINVTLFEENSTQISDSEKRKLRSKLKDPEVEKLLNDRDCQIFVIGYASPTGPYAANVKLSKERAKRVDKVLFDVINRHADLCGDYGPTGIVNKDEVGGNRAVEVLAGKLYLPDPAMRDSIEKFKQNFIKNHGVR